MVGRWLIREARRRAGLTQLELAERLGTQQSVVARWETGRAEPSLETVVRAIRACGFELALAVGPRDLDHERLIRDQLRLSPSERIADLLDRLNTEARLRQAVRLR